MGTGARQFIEALRRAEEARSPDPLLAMFADDAELWSAARPRPRLGREGAQEFWSEYLDAFRSVQSQFKNVVEADGHAALEWESDAVLPDGRHVRYAGITVIELSGDKVRRFRTYFDSAPFARA